MQTHDRKHRIVCALLTAALAASLLLSVGCQADPELPEGSDGPAPSGATIATTTAATSTEADATTTTATEAATTTGKGPTTTAKPTTATPKKTTTAATPTYTQWKPDPTKAATTTTTTKETLPSPPNPPTVNDKPDPRYHLQLEPIDIKQEMQRGSYTASNGQRLPYRYYIPSSYKDKYAYPVVLFLHGAGERGTDNENQLNYLLPELFEDKDSPIYNSIVIAPQCPWDDKWVDTLWEKEDYYHVDNLSITSSLFAALELLDEMMCTYSINPDRQYVIGESLGAFGAWDAIMRYPDRFAAAVPVSGGADPSYANKLLDMPIWAFHSRNDTVVPFNNTKKMVDAILAAGGTKLKFTETIDNHWVWGEAAREPGLQDWLFAQRRNS